MTQYDEHISPRDERDMLTEHEIRGCERAIRASGVAGLRIANIDWDRCEITLSDGRISTTVTADSDNAAIAAAYWPGSKIAGIDPDHGEWVIRGSERDHELRSTLRWWRRGTGPALQVIRGGKS